MVLVVFWLCKVCARCLVSFALQLELLLYFLFVVIIVLIIGIREAYLLMEKFMQKRLCTETDCYCYSRGLLAINIFQNLHLIPKMSHFESAVVLSLPSPLPFIPVKLY